MCKQNRLFFCSVTLSAALATAACSQALKAEPTRTAVSAAQGDVSDLNASEPMKTALRQMDSFRAFDNQMTSRGEVRLIGVLNAQAQNNIAIAIAIANATAMAMAMATARFASGAHSIHDDLTIKK